MAELSTETKTKIITMKNYTNRTWEEIANECNCSVSHILFLQKNEMLGFYFTFHKIFERFFSTVIQTYSFGFVCDFDVTFRFLLNDNKNLGE